MPHFTLGLDPKGGGPIIVANVGVSAPRGDALTAAGQAIPQAVPIRALVDTGASHTCIDPSIMNGLALVPTGKMLCHTPSTGAAPQSKDIYDVSLRIIASSNLPSLYYPTLPVMESDLFQAQGIHALIGRDVLSMCLLHYDGVNKLFTLAY